MFSTRSMLRRSVLAFAIPAAAAFVGLAVGCVKPQNMTAGAGTPAGQGTVKATKGDNGNTNVAVHVKHLAAASRVANDTTVYVVWIQAQNGEPQNAGAMTLNANLEGTFSTVTPHKAFVVRVTPEVNAQVSKPGHDAVFTANVERTE